MISDKYPHLYVNFFTKLVVILFPQNVRVEAIFPKAYFDMLHSSINGTYHRVRTLLKGETIIDGALVSVVDDVSH